MARRTLDEREMAIKERESNLNALEQKYDKQRIQIEKDHAAYLKEKADLIAEKDKEILEKKQEFEKYVSLISQRKKECQLILTEIEDLKRNKEIELGKYESEKIQSIEKKYRELMEQNISLIQKSYKEQNEKLSENLKWNSEQLDKSFNELLDLYQTELESKQKIIDNRIIELDKIIKDLETEAAKYSNLEEREKKLQMQQRIIEKREEKIDSLVERGVQAKYSELLSDIEMYQNLYNEYLSKYTEVSANYQKLLNDMTDLDSLQKSQLEAQLKEAKEQILNMSKQYGKYTDEGFAELKVKAESYDGLKNQYEKTFARNLDLEDQVNKLTYDANNTKSLKYVNDTLEQQIKLERSYLKQLSEQVEQLEARMTDSKNMVLAAKAIETPFDKFLQADQDASQSKNEVEWIDKIISSCEDAGYKFSRRLFYSFHTCLKTSDMSPLTVLAGVSGTGKSKLPQLYSKFGGLYFIAVPVQPDWDSPQSLFGYFNSIEKRFNATSLLRALVSFQADKSESATKDNITDLSNNVLIVLLDEMNLAHIELYFADLLSKLEEKRGEKGNVSFEVDLGASNEKYKIVLTDNVKWVGTMNEDETTKSLSDKVIDRGNVISFPRPESFVRYCKEKISDPAPKLNRCVWENWLKEKIDLTDDEATEFMSIITLINNKMKTVNRALGHRVWQSIENYIISHPLVYKFREDPEKRKKMLQYAFEEALVQKVMTKLRGIETDGTQGECLEQIRDILQNNGVSGLIEDYNNAMNSVTGTFVWDSARYLAKDYNLE